MGDEKRDEREWGIAKIVESNEEAILIAGFLESNGIPAEVESLHVEELPVNLGGLGEVRVRVPPDRLAEAQALLDEGRGDDAGQRANAVRQASKGEADQGDSDG
jgi:hypothetical protein